MPAAKPAFSAEQRDAIVAEWRRIAAEPPPLNPRPYGCLTVIVAIALFVLLPLTGIKPPPPWGTVLLVVLGLALAAGLFVGIFVGSGVHGRAALRASAALDVLAADPPSDAVARLRHAVSLIAHAQVSDGPTTARTIDIAEAKRRLGANLDYVMAVEQVLAEEIGALHVFIDAGG
ncbi:MAG: hypothetical protein K2X06_14860 [Burkholderiales bacterium]|nr:hypothetical protein [Burkholderiales bacterium]